MLLSGKVVEYIGGGRELSQGAAFRKGGRVYRWSRIKERCCFQEKVLLEGKVLLLGKVVEYIGGRVIRKAAA